MTIRALLAASATLLVAPAAADAATTTTRLPVGEADGVRIVQHGDDATIVFSRRASGLWKQIAGRPIEISCTRLGAAGSAGIMSESSSGGTSRAPRRSRKLQLGTTAGSDYCSVSLRYENERLLAFDTVVRIPVTQAGAVALDERDKAGALMVVMAMAGSVGDDGRSARFSTPAQLTRGLSARLLRRERVSVVALAAATDTPPPGTVGYWSDGAQHAASVTLSSAGRRLYVELGPDEELRTNVARTLFSIDD